MARERAARLSKLELELMGILWGLGRASVREIRDALPDTKRIAYTTVQTILARLEEKGAVRRAHKIGNAIVFEPVISRRATHRRVIDELLEVLGGARPLMAHLIDAGRLSLDDVHRIEDELRSKPRAKPRPPGGRDRT